MTDVKTAGHVSNVLKDVLKSNIGWEASGGMDINSTAFSNVAFSSRQYLPHLLSFTTVCLAIGNPIRQPRAGWYAKSENALFSLEIDAKMDTNFMTFMSMKSYGPNFMNTTLHLEVTISKTSGKESKAVYTIDGYHESKTSIHVPHKFELPEGGARKGDKILVNANLVSGAYFKINGIAFCIF